MAEQPPAPTRTSTAAPPPGEQQLPQGTIIETTLFNDAGQPPTTRSLFVPAGLFSVTVTLAPPAEKTVEAVDRKDPDSGTNADEQAGATRIVPFSAVVVVSGAPVTTVLHYALDVSPSPTGESSITGARAASTTNVKPQESAIDKDNCAFGNANGGGDKGCPSDVGFGGAVPSGNSTVGDDSGKSKGAPAGAIAGGVVSVAPVVRFPAPLTGQVGGILGLAVLLALLFLFLRRKKRPQRVGRSLEK